MRQRNYWTNVVLRNIIEQSIEWLSALYVHFLDFEKEFDSVYRDSVWLIMQSYGTSSKMISRVKAHYNDLEFTVVDEEDTTEWFKIRKGEILTSQTRLPCTCFTCSSHNSRNSSQHPPAELCRLWMPDQSYDSAYKNKTMWLYITQSWQLELNGHTSKLSILHRSHSASSTSMQGNGDKP